MKLRKAWAIIENVTALPREAPASVQIDAEKAVRYLLHRVRKPYELAVAPYAKEICNAMGEPNPARALRRVVEEALPGSSYAEARLRSLILRMDFDEALSVEEAANESNVSRRHLQRIRSDAVRMIAYRLRSLIDLDAASVPARASTYKRPLDELAALASEGRSPAPLDSTTRFHLEREAFVRARERDSASTMRAISRNLRRLACESNLPSVLRSQAEAELRLGRFGAACAYLDDAVKFAFDRKDAREFAAATLLRAEMQLFDGNPADAEELASGALKALGDRDGEWIAGHLLVARARLARGLVWELPPAVDTPAPESYVAVALFTARAEHTAATESWRESRHLAEAAMAHAETFGFDGALARCAATLAASCRAHGDLEGERRYRSRALGVLLRTQDYLTGCRLFPGEQSVTDDAVVDVAFERTRLLVPQIVNDSPAQAAATRALLGEILARAFDRFRSRRLLVAAAERVRDVESAFASYFPRAAAALEEMFALILVSLGRRCWSGCHPVLREALAATNATFGDCRPAGLLVGFPSDTTI